MFSARLVVSLDTGDEMSGLETKIDAVRSILQHRARNAHRDKKRGKYEQTRQRNHGRLEAYQFALAMVESIKHEAQSANTI